ncbi:hypothetical protein CEXT_497351 [Caerostris extrusa]|uniref:Uncharacterized protein n=1 Tax=Caerostris extrusa TaxID=172846 RepID=A0AAV4NBY1_CAEEX|nr:hypothetical protein CEXT_497351 [Caerostris extrusa]
MAFQFRWKAATFQRQQLHKTMRRVNSNRLLQSNSHPICIIANSSGFQKTIPSHLSSSSPTPTLLHAIPIHESPIRDG